MLDVGVIFRYLGDKMEKGDPTISLDLLVKSLLAMGANKKSGSSPNRVGEIDQ
jgi:hypothetical protein